MLYNIDISDIGKLIITILLVYFSIKITSKFIKFILFICIVLFVINLLLNLGLINV
jgi:hypothetical protein